MSVLDQIEGRALTGAEALFSELRSRISHSAASSPFVFRQYLEMPSIVRRIMALATPMLVDHLSNSEMAAWTKGIDNLAKTFPAWLSNAVGLRNYSASPPNPPTFRTTSDGDDSQLRFPLIEEAAKRLAERRIMTRDQWSIAEKRARDRAFFITGDLTEDTIEKVRNELTQDIDSGTSLQNFQNRVGAILEKSAIGPARIENIYRTNVQGAFRDGRETLMSNPIVSEQFPYQRYLAVHDARTRDAHLELEKLGIEGTAIYRREDPFWDYFTGPWDYQCRCGVQPMTIQAAARAGLKEAQIWLKSGVRPPLESRLPFIPFRPREGFGTRGRVAA